MTDSKSTNDAQFCDFHIGDILTITEGHLVSPDIGGVYRVLDFMEGWAHFTHQLPSASDRVRPAIIEQYPALENAPAPPDGYFDGVTNETASAKCEEWCRQVAWQLNLSIMLRLERTAISPPENPITSLVDMVGADRVIPIVIDEENPNG